MRIINYYFPDAARIPVAVEEKFWVGNFSNLFSVHLKAHSNQILDLFRLYKLNQFFFRTFYGLLFLFYFGVPETFKNSVNAGFMKTAQYF
jgi:hypothetical protein